MEDIPPDVKTELEKYAKQIGFEQILIIDAHNSLGEKIEPDNIEVLIKIGKECLIKLRESEQFPFKVGYANSYQIEEQTNKDLLKHPDLGHGQFGLLIISIKKIDY